MKRTSQFSIDKRLLIIISIVVLIAISLSFVALKGEKIRTITSRDLNTLIIKDLIRKSVIKSDYLIVSTSKHKYRLPISAVDMKKYASLYPVEYAPKYNIVAIVSILFVVLILGTILYLLFKRLSYPTNREYEIEKKSIIQETNDKDILTDEIESIVSDISFKDVAGMVETKEELSEIIDFLKNPDKYIKLDIRLPKGVLLAGPPGVGKTYIAKAVAGEAGVPFFYQSGANIVEIYVGMGAKRVHELFQEAKKRAPSIIFIDEIDAIGRARGAMGNEEREATLNQLLTEMDGFDSDSAVLVIGATNRIEMLDSALLRPGRFDRRVHIPLPDREERYDIIRHYIRHKRCNENVDIAKLSIMTVGFSSAALETFVNEAAMHAMKDGRKEIFMHDFVSVIEKVISGKRKILTLSDEERQIQASYQSGKALVATWLDISYEKIGLSNTIFSDEERRILSKSDYFNKIMVYLAGTVTTENIYGERYSIASEDIAKAKELAKKMVFDYSMGESYFATDKDVYEILEKAKEEVSTMLVKLESVRKDMESYLMANENIKQEEARDLLREIF